MERIFMGNIPFLCNADKKEQGYLNIFFESYNIRGIVYFKTCPYQIINMKTYMFISPDSDLGTNEKQQTSICIGLIA